MTDATSLPFTAGAAIDVDGDGVQELFIGGGHQQRDVLYRFANGHFEEIPGAAGIAKSTSASTTLGALVVDVDQDGDDDLITTRPEGIFLFINDNGNFSGRSLDTPLRDDTTPLSVAIADVQS